MPFCLEQTIDEQPLLNIYYKIFFSYILKQRSCYFRQFQHAVVFTPFNTCIPKLESWSRYPLVRAKRTRLAPLRCLVSCFRKFTVTPGPNSISLNFLPFSEPPWASVSRSISSSPSWHLIVENNTARICFWYGINSLDLKYLWMKVFFYRHQRQLRVMLIMTVFWLYIKHWWTDTCIAFPL